MNISPKENAGMAVRQVWTHRFRSMLTILGIVIGITTVVTVASMLTGLRQGIITFFQELGPDNIFVSRLSGGPGSNGLSQKERKRRPINPELADFIQRSCLDVEDVGLMLYIPPVVNGNPLTARVPGYESDNISIQGLSPNEIQLSPRDMRFGRFFTSEENLRGAKVAVIGSNLADVLFPSGKFENRTFMMDGAEYLVVGVFDKAKGGFFGENDQDNVIDLPLRTAQNRYPNLNDYFITAKARPGKRQEAFDEVQAALRRARHLATATENDFVIQTPDQIIQQFDQITGVVGLVAIAMSGLGLLVGGIGVMNIMLVSVTERTREIGVRKAIGARRRDIIGQFLTEAVALTGAGGALGIIISVLITLLVGKLIPSLPSVVPAWAVGTGFAVSVAVGVFFGVWPAVKAAQLDPVEALRYE
ncbi:MAG: ABC transporter permease [Acidobacteriia bacterium]|nr:ABC transporter permease [Terriglobia bacterium]